MRVGSFSRGVFVCLLALAPAARGQSFTATVSGIVTDPSAAGVPGAVVTAVNLETNVSSVAHGDGQGRYVIPALAPGLYSISVQAAGFKQLVRKDIRLRVDERLRLDMQLELGAATESVQVTAEVPLVESERSSLGAVIANRQLVNMPLNSRNSMELVSLVAGAHLGRAFGDESRNAANIVINGGRGNTSEVLTDGISNVTPEANPNNTVAVFPSVDAIEEFKVQTNSIAAEYGRTGGGVVNFIFKSGTNDLHGTAFEFLRNSALDANDFFSNRRGIPLTSFRRHQFGGTLGGPIVIPGLVDGHNKLFFFASYEGRRQATQNTTTLTVPTAAERAGDFSSTFRTAAGRCQPVAIFDPFSTRAAPGGGFLRTQFPDNRIPAAMLDPVARRVVPYYPQPNSAGDPCTGANNYTVSNPATLAVDQVDARGDANPTANDKLFLRVSYRRFLARDADAYQNDASPVLSRHGRRVPGRNAAFSYTRIFSPSLLSEFRFGVARFGVSQPPAAGENFDMKGALGFAGNFIDRMNRPLTFPRFAVTGYAVLGSGSQAFTSQFGTSYQWAGSVTKVKGAHTLKAGADFRVMQAVGPNGFNASGVYNFASNFTQGPDPTRAGPTSGNPMASLLVGVGTGSVQIVPRLLTSNNYFAVFLQDEFRVSRKLMLNFGIRYDLENGRKDRYDHLSWFDFTVRSPLADRVPSLPNLRGGLQFVNDGDNPSRQYDLDGNNIGPRFGFAYTVTPKTVIRGGYGLYYEPYSGRAASSGAGFTGAAAVTSWVSSLDGITPANRLANPFPAGLTLPLASAGGLLTAVGEDLGSTGRDGAFDRTARVGYVQQWNFTIQRGLPGNMGFELAYTGSKGTKLTDGAGWEENQLPPQALALGNRLLDRVPNPFFGVIESGQLAAATTTAGQLLRPYPQYTRLLNFRPNAASSIYHAFQAQLEKRFSRGVQFLAAYTAGKIIDDSSNLVADLGGSGAHQDAYNRRADRALSLLDVAQRLVLSYVIDLPFGRGRAIGSGWGPVLSTILGDWQVSGIATLESGLPFLVTNSSNNSGAFSGTQRPNLSRDPYLAGDRPSQERLARWFDTGAFSQPAAYTFGNAPRVLSTVRADGVNNFDVSLFKNFRLNSDGSARIQFRTEFFNFANTPQFNAPATVFGAGTFGVVSAQANIPRQIQFGLKVLF